MFRFEQEHILWFLCIIPFMVLLYWLNLKWKKNRLSRQADYPIFKRLMSDWSFKKDWIKMLLTVFAVSFILIAWANPQWGNRKQKIKAKSSDIIIALDISQSMLAEDVSPNRMERAKRFVNQLIQSLKGERIGLIFFAGSAYLQMPLSHDYATAEVYIKSASPRQAGTQGTVIADAIGQAEKVFGESNLSQKAMIIISDGENHESEAIEVAATARENGTFVYTLGIGSTEGAYIPVLERGRKVYKRDKSGNPVKSVINTTLLKEIAEAGGGKFYMIDQTMSAIEKLKSEISRLEKQDVEARSFTDYNSYFQYFLAMGILLLIIEFFISNLARNRTSLSRIFRL
ncbi:MAG: VWA domain-containing protein [Bacteroidia bacterium]|nr:VWA domain-containing protein [Bacteroidia bacterium]